MKFHRFIFLVITLFMVTAYLQAQVAIETISQTKLSNKEITAKLQLGDNYRNGILVPLNYEKALSLYLECAQSGSAKGMNAVGLMFKEGLGTKQNGKEAEMWLNKSANAGYAEAFFNLAEMYKYAIGVQQDFVKAYQYYKTAVDKGYTAALYDVGYCLYKGLGVTQSYHQAFEVLTQGANENSYSSMYLLGLCYRNGYGTTQNLLVARNWLLKSANEGKYQFAREELQRPKPENCFQLKQDTKLIASPIDATAIPQTHKRVESNVNTISVDGRWMGKVVTYDWSGQYIIGIDSLELTLTTDNNMLSGYWNESNSIKTNIQGIISNEGIYFTQGKINKGDHYNKSHRYEILNGNFEAVNKGENSYLRGTIQQYTPDILEPGRPIYIVLKKLDKDEIADNNSKISIKSVEVAKDPLEPQNIEPEQLLKLQQGLKVYPNPFVNVCTIQYNINEKKNVTLYVYSINGTLLYEENLGTREAGENSTLFKEPLSAGSYIIKLNCGQDAFSTIIVKL